MKFSYVILLMALLSACGENETDVEKNAINEVVSNQKQPIDKNKSNSTKLEPLIEFSYKDLNDKEVKLSDFRGKWVVVNFWATWCPPCRKEIPDFLKFREEYSDNVEIIGINNEDADIEVIKSFVDDYKVNYPILLADVYNPTEFDKQNTMGLPTTVIFNPKGEQVSKRVGPMHYEDLVAAINAKPNKTANSSQANGSEGE